MTSPRIYLDHAASTPLRPEAHGAMEPFLRGDACGNPSSLHADGQRARHALDRARDILAASLGAQASEIAFTSGGTEADNWALIGVMLAHRSRGDHLVVSSVEHEAVLETGRFLQTLGFEVSFLPVDETGQVDPAQLADVLTGRTVLVSVMHANNEVGTIQPLRRIAEETRARGILLHTDAVQSYAWLPVDVDALGVDLLSVSAHKISGPQGTGALYVRTGVPIEPLLHGGGQERERRSGTENVAGIAGFGAAAQELLRERETAAARVRRLRDRLWAMLRTRIPDAVLNGHSTERLPNSLHISIPGCDAESLLLNLDLAGISASSGSACASGSIEPSHVLEAMGLPAWRTRSALRLTLGRETTEDEIDRAAAMLAGIVARLRA